MNYMNSVGKTMMFITQELTANNILSRRKPTANFKIMLINYV